jgi:hypothetical protein
VRPSQLQRERRGRPAAERELPCGGAALRPARRSDERPYGCGPAPARASLRSSVSGSVLPAFRAVFLFRAARLKHGTFSEIWAGPWAGTARPEINIGPGRPEIKRAGPFRAWAGPGQAARMYTYMQDSQSSEGCSKIYADTAFTSHQNHSRIWPHFQLLGRVAPDPIGSAFDLARDVLACCCRVSARSPGNRFLYPTRICSRSWTGESSNPRENRLRCCRTLTAAAGESAPRPHRGPRKQPGRLSMFKGMYSDV